jgi:hypothetical protein
LPWQAHLEFNQLIACSHLPLADGALLAELDLYSIIKLKECPVQVGL